jgi:hypothetical protein
MNTLERKNILHITPHLGGGVGKVLLNYLKNTKANSSFSHKILSLEYANKEALLSVRKAGISIVDRMSLHPAAILDAVAVADVVLVHWWNHPLLYAFLVRESLPACRLVFWSHISGFHPPYVFARQALAYPDLFVFTTPISFQTSEVKYLDKLTRRKLRVIWATGGMGEALGVRPKPHAGFNIGYIGTVDYAKMHPHFLKMCSEVNIPAARFIICGGSDEKIIQRDPDIMTATAVSFSLVMLRMWVPIWQSLMSLATRWHRIIMGHANKPCARAWPQEYPLLF